MRNPALNSEDSDMNDKPSKSFLGAFFGSLIDFKSYPKFAERSGWSSVGHYVLLLTLVCSLYALIGSHWLNSSAAPYLEEFANQVPKISIKDGEAKVNFEQPHILKIEDETFVVIDVDSPAETHLEGTKPIIVLSKDKITLRDDKGKVEQYPLSVDCEINSDIVKSWIAIGMTWTLPVAFILCMVWQFFWKAIQVLVAATVVTLLQQSRPSFSTHLKLATYALGPAMVWGLAVFGLGTLSISIPGAGFIFWGILGGLTYMSSNALRNSPKHS